MRIMEVAIQRATMKSTIAEFEHVGLRAGRAPLLCLHVREGVEQHVDVATDKGVPVELLRHITSNFKNKLHFLWVEEAGWSLVSILNWVQRWRLSLTIRHEEFLLNNESGTIHGRHCICSSNIGVGAIMGI